MEKIQQRLAMGVHLVPNDYSCLVCEVCLFHSDSEKEAPALTISRRILYYMHLAVESMSLCVCQLSYVPLEYYIVKPV